MLILILVLKASGQSMKRSMSLDMPIIYHSSIKAWRDWSSYNLKTINLSTMVGTNHPALQLCNELGLIYALPFTYACDIATLIFSRIFDEFPNLRICTLEGRVPYFVPALMDSLDKVRWKRHKIKLKPSDFILLVTSTRAVQRTKNGYIIRWKRGLSVILLSAGTMRTRTRAELGQIR